MRLREKREGLIGWENRSDVTPSAWLASTLTPSSPTPPPPPPPPPSPSILKTNTHTCTHTILLAFTSDRDWAVLQFCDNHSFKIVVHQYLHWNLLTFLTCVVNNSLPPCSASSKTDGDENGHHGNGDVILLPASDVGASGDANYEAAWQSSEDEVSGDKHDVRMKISKQRI